MDESGEVIFSKGSVLLDGLYGSSRLSLKTPVLVDGRELQSITETLCIVFACSEQKESVVFLDRSHSLAARHEVLLVIYKKSNKYS